MKPIATVGDWPFVGGLAKSATRLQRTVISLGKLRFNRSDTVAPYCTRVPIMSSLWTS